MSPVVGMNPFPNIFVRVHPCPWQHRPCELKCHVEPTQRQCLEYKPNCFDRDSPYRISQISCVLDSFISHLYKEKVILPSADCSEDDCTGDWEGLWCTACIMTLRYLNLILLMETYIVLQSLIPAIHCHISKTEQDKSVVLTRSLLADWLSILTVQNQHPCSCAASNSASDAISRHFKRRDPQRAVLCELPAAIVVPSDPDQLCCVPAISITCILWTACPYPITPHMGVYPLITLPQGPDLNY